jgi:hypothetical protein
MHEKDWRTSGCQPVDRTDRLRMVCFGGTIDKPPIVSKVWAIIINLKNSGACHKPFDDGQ